MHVVYVGGWMRSGTTLLAELLNRQPGVLAVGEVSGIWDAVDRRAACSCGRRLTDCPLWGPAIDQVLRGDDAKAARLFTTMRTRFRTRRLRELRRSWFADPDVRELVECTRDVLDAVMLRTGSTVLVDTSKLLPGIALQQMINVPGELDVVQVVRDPRAVAAAEARTAKFAPGNSLFVPPGASAMVSLFRWYWANLSVLAAPKLFGVRHVTMTYEGLARDPAGTTKWLCDDLGIPYDTSSPSVEGVGGDTHIAVGNPARLASGDRPVRLDDRWRHELSGPKRMLVQVCAAPGLLAMRRSR